MNNLLSVLLVFFVVYEVFVDVYCLFIFGLEIEEVVINREVFFVFVSIMVSRVFYILNIGW